jgi:hypothetical protein
MASKLDAYREQILSGSVPDREIAKMAKVMTSTVRAYRARNGAPAKVVEEVEVLKEVPPQTGSSKDCPRCDQTASGDDEIQAVFGFRNIKNSKGVTKKVPQSSCYSCRKASLKAARQAKKAAAK